MNPILAGLMYVKMATTKITIEPQWLKKARKGNTPIKSLHLLDIFVTFMLIINVINNLNPCTSSFLNATVEYQKTKHFCNKFLHISIKKPTDSKKYKNHCVIVLLLMLSNDINPNPGPKNLSDSTNRKCSTCLNDIKSSSEYLECSSCNKHYHITCKTVTENTNDRNEVYAWICSSINCSPNHQKKKMHQNFITKNR